MLECRLGSCSHYRGAGDAEKGALGGHTNERAAGRKMPGPMGERSKGKGQLGGSECE